MKHGDIPTTPNPEMNSKLLVNTEKTPAWRRACIRTRSFAYDSSVVEINEDRTASELKIWRSD